MGSDCEEISDLCYSRETCQLPLAGQVKWECQCTFLYVSRRSNYEFYYIISRYFDDIPDELFIESFWRRFHSRKGTTDHDELLCERAFSILKQIIAEIYRNLGF